MKILPVLISVVCGFSLPMLAAPQSIAHQQHQATSGDMAAMIHVNPSDTPRVGADSQTWFTLTQPNGQPASLANYDCHVTVRNAQNQAIVSHLPLAIVPMDGQEALGTTINFPAPGSYTVVLSVTAKDNSSAPFEIAFPITAVSP